MRVAPWIVLTAMALSAEVRAQAPIVPRPAQPKPATPAQKPPAGQKPPAIKEKPGIPGTKVPPPVTPPGEVDWRGLEEGHKSGHHGPSPVTALIKNAPYRVEIATTDGAKVLMTNAFTLERRRVYEAPAIAGMAFSADGAWLYVVTGAGEVLAVDADTARTQPLGKLVFKPGEVVVDVLGAGTLETADLTVLLGQGPEPVLGQCGVWTGQRRARLHRDFAIKTPVKPELKDGWPEEANTPRLAAVSPNTKYRVTIQGGSLLAAGRFGGGDFKLNRTAVPPGVTDLDWMRDSEGLVATWPRRAQGGCKHLVGLRAWRHPGEKSKESGWNEWTLTETVEVVRGDLTRGVQWAPDGMRLLGVDVRGVLLIEPAPRFRGPLALVAPPSRLWPKLRPGVRALASTAGGALRLTELLMEQGDLDAARKQLAMDGTAGGPDVQRLQQRLVKLEEVRLRRAEELHLDLNELRSQKMPRSSKPALPQPEAGDEPAVQPPGAPTPVVPN
jgi:hypothetical protein